jgi:HPr kinase/phosphorylase
MSHLTVTKMFHDTAQTLRLDWIAGRGGGDRLLTSETVQKPSLALIGHLNFVHPNRVQVLGCAEMDFLRKLDEAALDQAIAHLYSTELAAVIVTNAEAVPDLLTAAAERTGTPLFVSPEPSPQLMSWLSHYLTQSLADMTTLHGVLLEVVGMGLLITGESSVGKSELALELITRGHRLVADDMVELRHVAPGTLEGRCPPLLRDFLEVRGLGILNIRSLFGDTAVKQVKNLKLIVDLVKPTEALPPESRLEMVSSTEQILGVDIPKVRIPVAAGRNLAVLVEAAARNFILKSRGIDSAEEFMRRQREALQA